MELRGITVTEDLPVPISVYNKTKMVAEYFPFMMFLILNVFDLLLYGFSPRMRLDVSVNMLTYQPYGKITVFGGNQTRPNIHIKDMVNVYRHFLINENIPSGCFNAGFENISILDIAKEVSKLIDTEIEITESNDPRSYRQDSTKLIETGFKPKYGIINAIKEIKSKFEDGMIDESEENYTVKWMKKLGLSELKEQI